MMGKKSGVRAASTRDYEQRFRRKVELRTEGLPTTTDQRYFVYDGDQMVLVMDPTGAVQNRYLWGAAVDEILADEQVGGELLWTLTDNLGTVRELVNNTSTVRNHIVYDTYGNVLSETAGGARSAIKFTGRYFDTETGLQWNLNRWYDAKTGRWLSQDPIGFEGGDGNLYRYVGNDPGNGVDPSGLESFGGTATEGLTKTYPLPYSRFPGSAMGYGARQAFQQWRSTSGIANPLGSPANEYMSWPRDRQTAFREAFAKGWERELRESASRNNIPVNLLLNVLMAELIDFQWNDYEGFCRPGGSIGPGQLTPGIIKFYALSDVNFKLAGEARDGIEMTARRIDRQIEELRLAVAGGGSATDPSHLGVPALQSVPALNPAFRPEFSRRDIQLGWNRNTDAWSKASRRRNPNAVYEAFSASSNLRSEAEMRRKAAVLTGILQWMNDDCPGAVGSTAPRLFERALSFLLHTPAVQAYSTIANGIWPW